MTRTQDQPAGITLRCTVLDGRRGARHDIRVEAPGGATVAALVEALRRYDPDLAADESEGVVVGDRLVPASHPLATSPILDGCIVVLGTAPPAAVSGALRLDVVAGPDSGRSYPLAPGDHTIGRCEPADLTLDDAQVSRQHVRITVTPTGVTARDLGTTNGTTFEADPRDPVAVTELGSSPTAVPVGAQLRIGASRVLVRVPVVRPATTRVTSRGRIEVNRPPRQQPALRPVALTAPARPAAPDPAGIPWIAMAVPFVLSVGAAWLLRQPTYLLFGLMSPVVLAGTSVVDRLSRRRRRRRDERRWVEQTELVQRRASLALAEELSALRRQVGDPATLLRAACTPSSRLWERTAVSEDLLVVGLGTGEVPSARLSWGADGEQRFEPAQATAPDDGTNGAHETGRLVGADPSDLPPVRPTLLDAPVTVSLVEHRHLGLSGDRRMVLRSTRWIIGQLLVGHGPETLQVLVLTREPDTWRWTRWAPHDVATGHRSTSETARRLDDLLRQRHELWDGSPWHGPRLVVLLDGEQLAELPGVADCLGRGPEVGVHVLALAPDAESLPAACGAVATLAADGTGVLRGRGSPTRLTIDGVRAAWAETVARALAPVRDATPAQGRLPSDVGLLSLLDVDGTDPSAVETLWRARPRSTRAIVGADRDGAMSIDLADDGPHVLVAGTTGSGKSELLRTLVASLALVNRPDELTFVLVDYKGGSAFLGCEQLPHTAGLVTDLDDQLAARALAALDAELRRRERLLQQSGCRDLAAYVTLRDQGREVPALPRTVLVIDEFRVLATELPEFLDGVVRFASTGRSLGVHVVLATQRPAGVVTADIKANVNLRICLRVRDRGDSDDVLDAPDAAAIDPETPGRGFARRGGEALVDFQTARVQTRTAAPPTGVEVRALDAPRAQPAADRDGASDLAHVVAACRQAAERLGIASAQPLWAAPLPERLPVATLEQRASTQLTAGAAPLGLVDLPRQQRQTVLGWHPVHDGHLAVAGASRTGRTTTLVTLAAGLVRRWSPADLHLHVLDAGSGGLARLRCTPHAGTVVAGDRPREVARFLARLTDEVADRRRSRAGSPALVLLIDGWEALVSRLEDVDHGRPVDDLLSLLRDGEPSGLRAVVTGGRGVLLSRVSAVVSDRLLLRPSDPTDLLLAGVAGAAVPAEQPAGRALRPADGAQVQLALPPAWAAIAETARPWPGDRAMTGSRRPLRLQPLPPDVDVSELRLPPRPTPWALVGVGGDEPVPVGIDLATERVVLVAGPPGSGRTTALTTMARSLHQQGARVLALCRETSPLRKGPWRSAWFDESGSLPSGLIPQASVVLVDDAERLDGPTESLLLAAAADPRQSVVVAGLTSALLGSYRGLAGLARSQRTGVLLRPESPTDGDVLGVRADLFDETPPGRALLVVRGSSTPVQVARSPSP